jgi:uncharacterized repeat protein (TIGR03803 family)
VPAKAATFMLPQSVLEGSTYNVTVKAHPAALNCTVSQSNVTSVSISCVSGTTSLLYSFGASSADASFPEADLVRARDGNFYGTTSSGGTNGGYGTIFKRTPAGMETVLFQGTVGGGTDGAIPYGSLIQASDGSFYGMTFVGGTSGDGTIFKINADSTFAALYSFGDGLH